MYSKLSKLVTVDLKLGVWSTFIVCVCVCLCKCGPSSLLSPNPSAASYTNRCLRTNDRDAHQETVN